MKTFSNFTSNVFLAPMAGITDAPMRNIVHQKCTHKVNIVSEMVAINALSRKNAKTYKIADVRNEPYPVVVQLVGAWNTKKKSKKEQRSLMHSQCDLRR